MKTLILIRHAHRDTSEGRGLDNSLSEKGRKQRTRMTSHFLSHFVSTQPALFSSPSKRCIETIEKLADETKTKIKILTGLAESDQNETSEKFKERIKQTLQKCLTDAASIIVICSHGDWIPMATQILCKKEVDLSKGGWIELATTDKQVAIKNIIQKFE